MISRWRHYGSLASDRNKPDFRGDRLELARGEALARLLMRFTADAKSSNRTRPQTGDPNRSIALLAAPVAAQVNTVDCLLDFRKQFAFAIADAQEQVSIGLEGRSIGRVGKGLFALLIHRAEGTLGFRQDVPLTFLEQASE
jgi:hypothetical protein